MLSRSETEERLATETDEASSRLRQSDPLWGAQAEELGLEEGEDGQERPFLVVSSTIGTASVRQVGRRTKRISFLICATVLNAVAAAAALALAHVVIDGPSIRPPYFWLFGMSGIVAAAMMLWSRPDQRRSSNGVLDEWVEAGREALFISVLLVVMAFFWRPGPISKFSFSRGTILFALVTLFVVLGVVRSTQRLVLLRLRTRGHNLTSVVVIGGSESAASFIRTIEGEPGTGYRIVGHIPEPGPGNEIAPSLRVLAGALPIDEIVIASLDLSARQIQEVLSEPTLRGVRIRAMPELLGLPPSKVQVVSLADFPMLTLFENPVRGTRWKVKRAVDVLVGALVLLLAGPLFLAIGLAVWLTSPGPALFRQRRLGMDGKPFNLLKFRTMVAGASEGPHREFMASALSGEQMPGSTSDFYKPADDARVTPLGRFLRRYSLDELPQFVNVIVGDMSIVGPRPAIPYEVDHYEEWQHRRFDVLPGITGIWQVSGRSRLSPVDMIRLDVHYTETWSLTTDFLIILRTIPAILRDDAR